MREHFSPELYDELLGMIATGNGPAALARWRAAVDRHPPTSLIALEMHRRWLAGMKRHAEDAAPAEMPALGLLFQNAQRQLDALSFKVAPPDSFSYSLDYDEEDGRKGPVPADLKSLEDRTIGWAQEQWWDWLNSGFDEITQDSPTSHLAFPPLRLYPLDRYIQQLAAALHDGKDHGLTVFDRVLTAIQCYLQLGDPSNEMLPGRNDPMFWELLGEMGPWDPEVAIPHGYLERLTADDKLKSMSGELCRAICNCIWASNARPVTLATFFDRFSSNVNQPAAQGSYMIATIDHVARTGPVASLEFAAAAADAMDVISISDVETREVGEYVDAVLTSGRVTIELLDGIGNPGFSHLIDAIQPYAKKYSEDQGLPSVQNPRSFDETVIAELVPV